MQLLKMFSKLIALLVKIRVLLANFFLKKFIITTEDLLRSQSKNKKVIKIKPDGQFTINYTRESTADKYFSKWIGKHKIEGQFLVLLENVYIVSEWSIPVTHDGQIILETSGRFSQLIGNIVLRSEKVFFAEYKLLFFLFLIKISNLLKFNISLKKKIEFPLFHMVPRHGFSLSQGPTFSHWIFENLPQVKMYYEALNYDPKIKLYIGKIRKDWQILTLKFLGIKKKNIFEFDNKFYTKISKLYICRLPYIHSTQIKFDPVGRLWVNKKIRHSVISNYPKKIKKEKNKYIKIAFSRRYCFRRRLVNEDQYFNILSKKNYKIIYPEKISEIEKIICSYFAKFIIGLPSGSALANFIFSDKPNLIDIQGKKETIPVWFLLSKEFNINYSLHLADFTTHESDFRDRHLTINYENFPRNL